MKKTNFLLTFFAILAISFSSFAENFYPPAVETLSPSAGVRICFYVDGCNRMHENNAYIKAINGLEAVLKNNNNTLAQGLSKNGNPGVRIDSKTGYLLTPFSIRPFDLTKKAEKVDYKAEDNETLDEWLNKIFSNEKNLNANNVICVISNNKIFQPKQGEEVKRNGKTSVYCFYAPYEYSVNDKWFISDWTVEEWANFINEELGRSNIANDISKNYFDLNNDELNYAQKLYACPGLYSIDLKGLLALRTRPMWSVSIEVNGTPYRQPNEDAASFPPVLGENRVAISLVSPTGSGCKYTWGGKAFSYGKLSDQDQSNLKATLAKSDEIIKNNLIKFAFGKDYETLKQSSGKWGGIMRDDVRSEILAARVRLDSANKENQSLLDNYAKFSRRYDDIMARVKELDPATAKEFIKELEGIKKEEGNKGNLNKNTVEVLEKKLTVLEDRVKAVETSVEKLKIKTKVLAAIEEKIAANKKAKNVKELEDLLAEAKGVDVKNAREFDKLNRIQRQLENWKPIVESEFDKKKNELISDIKSKIEANGQAQNVKELEAFLKDAQALNEKNSGDGGKLENLIKSVKAWNPIYENVFEGERSKVISEIQQKMADNPEAANLNDLEKLLEETKALDEKDADSADKLQSIAQQANAWQPKQKEPSVDPPTPPPPPGLWWLVLIIIAAMGAGVYFFFLAPKVVATIKVKIKDKEMEKPLKTNVETSLMDIGLDMRAKVVKSGEDLYLELKTISGETYLRSKGATAKKMIKITSDVATQIGEGAYQIFKSESSMVDDGTLTWNPNEE